MRKNIIREHFDSIDSTHTWATLNAQRLNPNTIIITSTDEQTAGKGRFGHKWSSPKGQNLAITLSFAMENVRKDIGNIPQVLAVSAAKMLQRYNVCSQLKWPNDILISGKKIAGILTTTTPLDQTYLCVIASLGLNVTTTQETLEKLGRPATSILLETGKLESIEAVRESFLEFFLTDLRIFYHEGFSPFIDFYRSQMAAKKGDKICFHHNSQKIDGIFEEITPAGTLRMRLDDGSSSEIVSGDISVYTETIRPE